MSLHTSPTYLSLTVRVNPDRPHCQIVLIKHKAAFSLLCNLSCHLHPVIYIQQRIGFISAGLHYCHQSCGATAARHQTRQMGAGEELALILYLKRAPANTLQRKGTMCSFKEKDGEGEKDTETNWRSQLKD